MMRALFEHEGPLPRTLSVKLNIIDEVHDTARDKDILLLFSVTQRAFL